MKETTKTSRTAGYLEKMFRKLNEHYFNNTLETPIITIQSTPKAYGHITTDKRWKTSDGKNAYELNIGAGTLDRPIEDVVATMMHEMVHLYCMQNNIKDTSRNYTYHNKNFKTEAEKRGLNIEHHPQYGWTITTPNDNLIEFILNEEWSEIKISRYDFYIPIGNDNNKKPVEGKGKPIPTTGKTSSTRKYQCPKCLISIRATKDLTGKLQCVDCSELLIEV